MPNIVPKLKSRGYWDVTMRPVAFAPSRIPSPTALSGILQRCNVSLRGWDFPHFDERHKRIVNDHLEHEFQWEHYIEVLRFFQSGLFVHLSGLPEDWRDESSFWPAPQGWTPCSELGIENAVFRATEVFDFAARLSETEAGDEYMHIEIRLTGLQGRKLSVGPNRMPFVWPKVAQAQSHEIFSGARSRAELIANRRDWALQAAKSLFQQFDWDPPIAQLREVQQQIGRF
jgi:hypothetical protein